MENVILTVESNKSVASDTYLMRLTGDLKAIKSCGEFINIKLPGYYLRRPISVCDFSKSHVDILYKILGNGTYDMSTLPVGEKLDVLVGLGNGFTIKKNIKPLIVAGGIGVAPVIAIAREYSKLGIKPAFVYGARSSSDLVLIDTIKELADLYLCTDDGTLGMKGNVIDCIRKNNIEFDYYYACGPYNMLKYLAMAYPNGCVSLEARMGCGFGACMGCSIKTTKGPKRVCKEGPVFEANEVEF